MKFIFAHNSRSKNSNQIRISNSHIKIGDAASFKINLLEDMYIGITEEDNFKYLAFSNEKYAGMTKVRKDYRNTGLTTNVNGDGNKEIIKNYLGTYNLEKIVERVDYPNIKFVLITKTNDSN